uniref:Uncharacterized protein n=1 Tax=Rhizophora mucronata TaxID=61149 RepID=A0A2P2QX29_RHIMU
MIFPLKTSYNTSIQRERGIKMETTYDPNKRKNEEKLCTSTYNSRI